MIIIMLGAPGTGKGTVASILSEKLNIPQVSTGDIFRKNIAEQTELGKLADSYISKGNLVPDDVTIKIVEDRLKQDDVKEGIILDGFPRTIKQAEELDKILEKENELLEIARVVGQDVLSDDKKLLLEVASSIRIGFLQQNSFNDIDTSVTIEKQFKMMETIILIYDRALKLINKGIPISEIKKTGLLEEYNELKYNVKNDEIEKIDEFDVRIKNRLKKLEDEYREHI